jgi:hypothetical protein
MKRLLIVIAVLVCVLAGITLVVLPPRPAPAVSAGFTPAWPVVRGAYHVHSVRSDGTGTLDEIAAAAADAGLQFVILTDHGNGTRPLEPPAYRSGVLCIDGVEISTQYGHYVALGMSRTPYPLGGHPREVIDDVRRFGGFGFAAHPGSPKAALRWDDWAAAFDGLEWLNADSEWRDEFWGSLGGVLLTYAFRPTETLAGVLDRPQAVLQQWERLTAQRRVPVLAGADAHARLGFRQTSDPYEDYVVARLPAYGVSFRAFVTHAVLDERLTGDAAVDSVQVLSALREGRTFTSIDGLAALSAFEAKATSGAAIARVGEYLDPEGPVVMEAQVAGPEGTTLVVLRDGVSLHESAGNAIRLDVGGERGAYRIEARLPPRLSSSSVPWVLTNPIYVGLRDQHAQAVENATAPPPFTTRAGIATAAWRAEASEGSESALAQSALADATPALEWRFRLAGGERAAQYAAMRFPVGGGLAAYDGLQLRARSDAPRRVWAQLRAPGAGGGERWGRTFYLDESLAAVDLRFSEFRPLGPVSTDRPPLDRVDSLLLVVDTLNTLPTTAGAIWITDLWLAK